jgi:hypothetical protein
MFGRPISSYASRRAVTKGVSEDESALPKEGYVNNIDISVGGRFGTYHPVEQLAQEL